MFKEKINSEIQLQKKLDDEMKIVQKSILERKRSMTGAQQNQSKMNVHESQTMEIKQTKVLENRLEKANQKFNEILGKNKGVRF